MLSVGLTYRSPLVAHPDSSWLHDRFGLHFEALKIFAEACWAWEGFLSQRHIPPAAARWDVRIHDRPTLFDYAIQQRKKALKLGFFKMTADQLEELLQLSHLDTNQTRIRDQFVALADRHEQMQDEYGQALPAPLLEILLAIEKAPPYKHQGLCALTKRIRLRKQIYFAKLTDETLSGSPLAGQDEFNEVSTYAALRALCPAVVPTEAFHLVAADGQHCTLVAAVPGRTYEDMEYEHIAPLLDTEAVQWAVIAEWLLGMADRSSGNLVVDTKSRRIGMIDASFAWRFHPYFLSWNDEDPEIRYAESFAHVIFEAQDAQLTFSRTLLEDVCRRESLVLDALAVFPMAPQHIASLQQQCAILRQALATTKGDIRLAKIEHVAQKWYTKTKRNLERGTHHGRIANHEDFSGYHDPLGTRGDRW